MNCEFPNENPFGIVYPGGEREREREIRLDLKG